MTTRADMLVTLLRTNRRMDTERRAFTAQVSEIVRRTIQGRTTFDQLAYDRITLELTGVFDIWYGQWPNDRRARFLTLIVDESRRASAVALQHAIDDIRWRLPVPLVRAIEREAA